MAVANNKGTAVSFVVQAWIDPSTGAVHLTSNDKDLGGGFHTNLRKGTAADRACRLALEKMAPGEKQV